jgi:hypothetical protein
MVTFSLLSSSSFLRQRFAKIASPTAKASSTIRTSGLTWIAVAKASRTYIPLEYSLTGRLINSPTSAKLSISGKIRSVSAWESPKISLFKKTFSRPENSGLNPAPSSSSAAILPSTDTRPLVGCTIPLAICSIVLLPDPFGPMIPRISPASTEKLTFVSAQKSEWYDRRRHGSTSRSRSAGR